MVLYVFGVFLLYTGFKMFTATEDEEFEPHESKVYKFISRIFRWLRTVGTENYG